MAPGAALGYAGGLLAEDLRRRRGLRAFCYHGVIERRTDSRVERNMHLLSSFREQARYLRRFRVLGLDGLLEELARPGEDRTPAAIVTFDDACASNILAAEILATQQIPWFMFVPSGEVGVRRALWTVDLSLLLLHGEASQVEILGRRWILASRDEREAAFQALRYEIKSLPAQGREVAMESIRAQFPAGESERLVEKFPAFRMLTWQEVEGFANAGVEIGSHGVYHELHHSRQPEEVRRRELADSKKEIEERLGRACRSFSYPNGDYVSRSAVEVRDAGYTVGFTTWPGTIGPGSSPYLLCRLHPPASISKFVREYWWEPQHEMADTLPKISVEQRQAHLDLLLASGRASRGLTLLGPPQPVRSGASRGAYPDFANPPKLARAVAILDGLASVHLREPRIVDLGCGSGWLTAILGTFGPTLGVGLTKEAACAAQERYPDQTFVKDDLFEWDYPAGAFDLVVSHQVLEKVPEPERYLRMAHELLRDRGYLILTTPNARTIQAIAPDDRADGSELAEHPVTLEGLRLLLEPLFRVERLTTIAPNFGSRGLYRLMNSRRLRRILAGLGLGRAFDRARLEHGYGLHSVVVARKR